MVLLAECLPENGPDVRCARPEDRKRIQTMMATPPGLWADEDIDLVSFRAGTTIGGAETFKWVLREFLRRADRTWLLYPDLLVTKLDQLAYDDWPVEQRHEAQPMIAAWMVGQQARGEATQSLADWLRARSESA